MINLKRQLAFVWGCLMSLLMGTVLSKFGVIEMGFQQGEAFRNWTGSLLLVSIFAQWALSIGRLVYQKQGAQWDVWVEVHQALAWAVPLLALVHSLQLGYGLLGFLPLALFASLVFGSWVSLKEQGRKWLPYHLMFAALTLAGSLMHLWRVVYFR
ncbi:MAG: hypothetical protein ACPG08_01825 [Flavobacteriales bacterium]